MYMSKKKIKRIILNYTFGFIEPGSAKKKKLKKRIIF